MKPSAAQWALAASALQPRAGRMCVECARHFNRTQRRPLSASAVCGAGAGVQVMPKNISDSMAKNQKLRSAKSQMKEIKAHQVPNDLGKLPQAHLLPPLAATLPLLLRDKDPRKFLRLLYHRAKLSIMGLPSVWAAARMDRKKDYLTGKYVKKQPLELRERAEIAVDLHRRINTAISQGDLRTVGQIACRGVAERIRARQQYRAQTGLPPQPWALVRYRGVRPPRWLPVWLANLVPGKAATVLLDYAAPLPWGQNSYLRQVTVRIRSRQAFDRRDGAGSQVRDVTEYVVIQSMSLGGDAQSWRFWGTVDPLPLADVDTKVLNPDPDSPHGSRQDLSISEKFRMALDGSGASANAANAASHM